MNDKSLKNDSSNSDSNKSSFIFPKVSKITTPASILELNPTIPDQDAIKYENSFFADMANDIKGSQSEIKDVISKQLPHIEQIANSARSQAEFSESISKNAKIQADIATKQSNKADIKGTLSLIIAIIALLITLLEQWDLLTKFFTALLK